MRWVHIPPESLEHKPDYRLFTSGPRWPSRSPQLQSKLRHVSVLVTLSLSFFLCVSSGMDFFLWHVEIEMIEIIMCCGCRVPLERPVCPVSKGQRWADQSCFLVNDALLELDFTSWISLPINLSIACFFPCCIRVRLEIKETLALSAQRWDKDDWIRSYHRSIIRLMNKY